MTITAADLTGLAEALAGDYPNASRLADAIIGELIERGAEIPSDATIDAAAVAALAPMTDAQRRTYLRQLGI